jgi:hypothetical protein
MRIARKRQFCSYHWAIAQLRKYVYNRYELKKKTTTRRSQAQVSGARAAGSPAEDKPVALTLKVDQSTYVRLCTFGANERKTNQEILKRALEEYLDRAGA